MLLNHSLGYHFMKKHTLLDLVKSFRYTFVVTEDRTYASLNTESKIRVMRSYSHIDTSNIPFYSSGIDSIF